MTRLVVSFNRHFFALALLACAAGITLIVLVGNPLARALLAHAEQVHTAGGSHATELVAWRAVRSAREIAERLDEDAARRVLEEAAEELDSVAGLPWVRNRKD